MNGLYNLRVFKHNKNIWVIDSLYRNNDNWCAKLFKLIVAAYHSPFIKLNVASDKSYL